MEIQIIFGIFSGTMLFWNIYLLRQNQELVNKLMSRNFGEYVTAKKYEKGSEDNSQNEDEWTEDPYDKQKARELNGILGMG